MPRRDSTTWMDEINGELALRGETWEDVVACTLTPEELLVEFDPGYGGVEGRPFTVWTANRVYFPRCYDGAESCASVPRNPCDEATEHVGGG